MVKTAQGAMKSRLPHLDSVYSLIQRKAGPTAADPTHPGQTIHASSFQKEVLGHQNQHPSETVSSPQL